MNWEKLLRKYIPFKEIGWKEHGEEFTRFALLKTKFFNIYLHKINAPIRPPLCHDHPWHFWVLVLSGGYWEEINGKTFWRKPGSVFYRTAKSLHNTITKVAQTNWSLVITSKKVRDWSIKGCE